MDRKLKAFERLLDIMDQLREGCPWDKKQTFESLRTLTIEETYELADSILKGEKEEIKKELGDILLHIVFYAKIGSETNDFDIADVCDSISEKLIYRHPHIFSDTKVANAKEVEENWEQLKLKEKNGNKTVLQGVPTSLPAMVKANRIQDKVRGVGFDWDEKEQVWDKVKEEMLELETEIKKGNKAKMEEEFGDMFFSLINAARLYGVNPENALERTNQKFTKRFNYLENKTLKQGLSLKDMNLQEMDEIWEEAKLFDK
nr:nucleoside triphosphate pyrophosphohydrolase [uncultured Marinifilum sp.]